MSSTSHSVVIAFGLLAACDSTPVTADEVAQSPVDDSRTADAKTSDDKKGEDKPDVVPVPSGPITAQTLVTFLPDVLGGARMEYRQPVDEALAVAAYKTPTGYINVNLALVRDVAFERAQVAGAESDEALRVRSSGVSKRGVAVGPHRGLLVTYDTDNKVELLMLFGDRISVIVSREGKGSADSMVALATELDLAGLAALAPRVPARATR